MTTNNGFDQDKLIINGKDHTSSYQDTNNLDADNYGTFSDGVRGFPITTTSVSSYPYALSSESPTVVVLGGCPACKTGMLEIDFTYFGLCCAILLFPIGILCCLGTRQRRCNFCGAIFP